MYAYVFLLYCDHRDLHVRTHSFPTRRSSDLSSQRLSRRTQVKIDIAGLLFFLFPAFCLIFWLSIPFFYQSFILDEQSSNSGGLVRWPVKLLIPVGFVLLILAGVSHLFTCIGFLRGDWLPPTDMAPGRSSEEQSGRA